MSDKEKIENTNLQPIEDDDLDKVTGGGSGIKPPRVDLHPYTKDVKDRM
ncbi:MAG: hypothetical protein ACI4VF_04260 [Lachnospirales bacterium]